MKEKKSWEFNDLEVFSDIPAGESVLSYAILASRAVG